MKKITANYALTNPNFVIQNLVSREKELPEKPLLYILKNILQRGFPTIMSRYLQEQIGAVHNSDNFNTPFLFVSDNPPLWLNTIKGDEENQYFPAKEFFEDIIPEYFGEYRFVQSLILPEANINEITGTENPNFTNQQVDFYLPQAKLVIEIDGQQHKEEANRIADNIRDNYLLSNGISTVRIDSFEIRNRSFQAKIDLILNHLRQYERILKPNRDAFKKIRDNNLNGEEIQQKILPTAVIRFQLLLIELLLNDYLQLDKSWSFNIICNENEKLGNFAELAIEDFFTWFENIYKLKEKRSWTCPKYVISKTNSRDSFDSSPSTVNIDFSLFSRWTDESTLYPDLLFVRTDYFGTEKNYFSVSCTTPIKYNITSEDTPVLEFFLRNIFEKEEFRQGQLPIISSVLNRDDTVGLLPTGGGKSMCYQLPCLLQPSISFVVCPIKSLMYDQYENMKNAYITNTTHLNSDLTAEEKKAVQKKFAEGKYLFIWISPERFQIKAFREYLSAVNASLSVAYAVVDEVHCLSEWGHDFRTSYLNLSKTVQKLCPTTSFVGLTATASVNVLKDIKVEFARNNRVLKDENIKSLLDYSRKELNFEVIEDKNNKLHVLKEIMTDQEVLNQPGKAALVFTPHVNGQFGCYSVANSLKSHFQKNVNWYSGEVPKVPEYDTAGQRTGRKLPVMSSEDFQEHKVNAQLNFKKSQYPALVATKAFGMGIDKQNIYYTFHYGLPSSVEALYQEAGRAGRWDKRNPDKAKDIAKCYVLYSKETTDESTVNRLFEQETTFTEIQAINDEVKWEGRDIFRQIFLFLQGQQDVSDEYKVMKLLVKNYFVPRSKQRVYYSTIQRELRNIDISGGNEKLRQIAQKGIYRLSLLGIVKDWTNDFVNQFEVEFGSAVEADVFKSLKHFITKYEPGIDLQTELDKQNRPSLSDSCMWYLLKWTFDNVAYSRKQSLKTLSDWCGQFQELGNERFKQRIDNYFRFTDTTFIFQYIGENPLNSLKWFDVFYRVDRDSEQNEIKFHIPEIADKSIRKLEFERLRDSLSRFLESYRNNTGLDFVSGIIRLFLGEYEDPDGRKRFESALREIKNSFFGDEQEIIVNKLVSIGNHMPENSKENLCSSLMEIFPNRAEQLAGQLGLFYLLDDLITTRLQQLKSINKKINEQLEQIGTL